MMNAITKLAADAVGVARVCGPSTAAKWMGHVVVNLPNILTSKNLQSADRAMGSGPFKVSRANSRALLAGPQVFSGLREIWVRDVYLKNNFLTVPHGASVVDLGANLGVFSALALAQNATAKVIAVEPSITLLSSLEKCIAANGWSARLTPVRGFVGNFTETQNAALRDQADYAGAPTISEAQLISRYKISKVDFLKCDIEGSESFLIESDSQLLAMSDRLAIELHDQGVDIAKFLGHLERIGFEVGHVEWSIGSCIALCRRRSSGHATIV
jgi:FkbM family methyltransferase